MTTETWREGNKLQTIEENWSSTTETVRNSDDRWYLVAKNADKSNEGTTLCNGFNCNEFS